MPEFTPPEHIHALDVGRLLDPAITFFTARIDNRVVAVGALRYIAPGHVELKSMHTAAEARGQGVGRAMLTRLLAEAVARSADRASLETGTMEAFGPARALYESVGFEPCEPFGDSEQYLYDNGAAQVTDAALETWIEALPKVELHVHLEGSMSVDTVSALSERHGVDPAGVWPDGLPEAFSFDGFPDFARQFFYGLSLLRSGDDLATITADLAASLAEQNVRYAEVTTTAFTHFLDRDDRPGMSYCEYREGLNEGTARASTLGVELGWVVDIPRDLEMPGSTVTIDYLESTETPDGLVAIGLGGYEVGFPARPYANDFARAKALGLHSVPHAGETEGAGSVRSALHDLGAERIGHGVRCLEDPALVAELVERDVMLEVCLTSNDLLQVVGNIEQHAFPELREAGLRTCLNTDDPGWFATDLTSELKLASSVFGVSADEHLAMQLDAVAASFAPESVRERVRAELTDL